MHKIISTLLASKESFDILAPYITRSDVDEASWAIFEEIQTYYERDPKATKVDNDVVLARLVKKNNIHPIVLEDVFSHLPEPSSAPNLIETFVEAKKERLITSILVSIHDHDNDKIKQYMEEYLTYNIEEIKEEMFNGTAIEELENHFTGRNLIPLFPTMVSDAIGGGIPRQSQICIFARPDVGKSTAAINTAVGAAERGFRILYIGNEDPAPKMMYRIITRFTRVPEEKLRTDPKGYFEAAIAAGYPNLYFVPMHPGGYTELRKWIERIKPDIVVIDQIRNMHFKKESMTINLEQGCIATRNLAKEFNFVSIIITQAGDSARNKPVLSMEDVEWSNTGVAAQCDLMIGMGQTEDMKENGRVMLSFPKNKLSAPIKPFSARIEYNINRIST